MFSICNRRILASSSGSALVQVMVGVAMVSIVAVGMASLTRDMNYAVRHTTQQQGVDGVAQLVLASLNSEKLCDQNLWIGNGKGNGNAGGKHNGSSFNKAKEIWSNNLAQYNALPNDKSTIQVNIPSAPPYIHCEAADVDPVTGRCFEGDSAGLEAHFNPNNGVLTAGGSVLQATDDWLDANFNVRIESIRIRLMDDPNQAGLQPLRDTANNFIAELYLYPMSGFADSAETIPLGPRVIGQMKLRSTWNGNVNQPFSIDGCFSTLGEDEVCRSLGGQPDPVLGCAFGLTAQPGDCTGDPFGYISGINPDGTVQCSSTANLSCQGTDQFLVGIDLNGDPICSTVNQAIDVQSGESLNNATCVNAMDTATEVCCCLDPEPRLKADWACDNLITDSGDNIGWGPWRRLSDGELFFCERPPVF